MTERIRSLPLNALAVRAENDLTPKDPAPGKLKRLHVKYSYGNETVRVTDRNEGDLVVLPEVTAVVPAIGLILDYVVMEPYDTTPGRNYPRKLRIYFRENTGDRIAVERATWLRDSVGIQKGKPFACQYELETSPGTWVHEGPEKIIETGRRMRLYVGLDSDIDEQDMQRLNRDKRLGTLMIPAQILGVSVIFKIKL